MLSDRERQYAVVARLAAVEVCAGGADSGEREGAGAAEGGEIVSVYYAGERALH